MNAEEALKDGFIESVVIPPVLTDDASATAHCIVAKALDYNNVSQVTVVFVLDVRNYYEYAVWVHGQDLVYPVKYSMFDTRFTPVNLNDIPPGESKFKFYTVKPKRSEKVSSVSKPCLSDGIQRPGPCLKAYFRERLQCEVTMDEGQVGRCESDVEFKAFLNLTRRFSSMMDEEVFALTGCARQCQEMFYEATPEIENVFNTSQVEVTNKDSLILSYYTASTGLEVEKDILVYDKNDLIADIGGYLGLLLGFSVLSMFKSIEISISKFLK